jgi:alkylmercury lyase
MSNVRVDAMAQKVQERLDFGPDHSRLLLQVVRQLARGRPLSKEHVDHLIADLRIAHEEAQRFLRQRTERDEADQIVGVMGLSLNGHPHRLDVAGVSLAAWCALDTLFLPALLQQAATIESPSPVTHRPIRLRVKPERVDDVSPASAVLSFVLVDSSREERISVEAMWSAFCTHVHFFAMHDEAERWAKGRDDLAILTVAEGFELGQMWPRVLLDGGGRGR